MSRTWFRYSGALLMVLISMTMVVGARGDDDEFSVLYKFQPADPNTNASPLGSQPYSRPI